MKRGIAFALILAGLAAMAQVVPWGLDVERGRAVLVFTSNCDDAAAAAKVKARVVLVLPEGQRCQAEGAEVFHDPGGLWRATFYVDREPTVVVLKEGQQVVAATQPLTPGLAESVNQVLQDDRSYPPRFALKIRPGDRLAGDLAGYTGLVAFWKEGCPWCEKERDDLARLCRELPVLLVSNTPGKPDLPECTRRGDWVLYRKWGIPGAPTHVWIEEGVVKWTSVGFQPELTKVLRILKDLRGRR
ncbi:TlpA family protein disulfide reductase [Oceanithermus desulfurans]|uniref:Thioredoxin domain-containing protein n=2 Tax=Oceanithermus desulfurans TaxID=227924 RepID=A0A511RG08_9DEIN|nr:hypothetical protein [Oceanithermus desulfurans]MBB6030902.1 hypothetical protein [Oceanithermus desulfurans]GEM88573.1 hypothetical protein ODE01S_00070 [Oceanithermus desulfurans NBRC 100063]